MRFAWIYVRKNRCSSNFSYPINLQARSHFAEPAGLSSRCDWSIAMIFSLTGKGHWPVVYASNLQHIFFAQSSLLRTKTYGVVLRVWSRTTSAQAAEVNLLVFITFFWVKHEKLCNFELLLFENGRTYLTSFLIYCRKNCALSVSTNNHPRINVRKNRCSSNHTQLCFMWKSENNFIGIQDFKKTIKFITNNIKFYIIININFSTLWTLLSL